MSSRNTPAVNVFTEAQIATRLPQELPRWSFANGHIERVFKTAGWKATLMVVNAVGHLAEVHVLLVQGEGVVFLLVHERSVTSECTVRCVLIAELGVATHDPAIVREWVSTALIFEQARDGPRITEFAAEESAATEHSMSAAAINDTIPDHSIAARIADASPCTITRCTSRVVRTVDQTHVLVRRAAVDRRSTPRRW